MTRALSILLIVGQIILGLLFCFFAATVLLMAFPSEFRDTMLASSENAPDASALLRRCLAAAIVMAGWFFVLRLLRKVVRAVIHGDPFLPENIHRLRNIWLIMAATEFFHVLAKFLLGPSPNIEGAIFEINVGTWFFIFVIAAISEAFRHGAALRADQELTI